MIQMTAHGFSLTPGLKEKCQELVSKSLFPLSVKDFRARWTLSLESHHHVATLEWHDGPFHGVSREKTNDMYKSLTKAVKKATEQIKKSHSKSHPLSGNHKRTHHNNQAQPEDEPII